MEQNKSKNQKKEALELDQETKEIFAEAIKEAEKIKKSKIKQDISCGKVVCYINEEKEKRNKPK